MLSKRWRLGRPWCSADTSGLGPLVTSAEVAELRPWNFGARLLREPLDPAGIVRQVQRYDAADASAVSRYIREQADLSTALEQYLHLYDELMNEPLLPPTTVARDLDEYVRHTASQNGADGDRARTVSTTVQNGRVVGRCGRDTETVDSALSAIHRVRQDCGRSSGVGEWQLREDWQLSSVPRAVVLSMVHRRRQRSRRPGSTAHGAEALLSVRMKARHMP